MEEKALPARRSWPGIVIPAFLCLVLGALGGIGTALVTKSSGATPVRFTPPHEPLPDFRLRDQDGHWWTPRDVRGDVLVLTFLYSTCRDLCPRQASEIAEAVLAAGGGVQVYGVSVDPVGDTPERARNWLKRFGLYGGPVHFLVGSRRELAPVWAQFGIVPIAATPEEAAAAAAAAERLRPNLDPEPIDRAPPDAALDPFPATGDERFRGRARHHAGVDFEHSAYVMLIDKHGRQRVGFSFELLEADLLLQDLRVLKAEA